MLDCAFKMAFFGFLSCGEFTCRFSHDHEHIARIQDIAFDKGNKWNGFHLRNSKCDPFGKGVEINIFKNDVFKPVETMYKYINRRLNSGATLMSPLFIEDELSFAPLTWNTSLLRDLLHCL